MAFSNASLNFFAGQARKIPSVLSDLKPRFLEGLSRPEVESVVAAAEHRKLPKNSVITHQDHPATHMFLLLTGRARYFLLTEKGQKAILLWITPGETIGAMALASPPGGYILSAESVTKSTVLAWDRATIRRLAVRHPRLVENAFSVSIRYLAAYRAAHLALISDSARKRLIHVLVGLASGIGQRVAGGVELKIRNEELANEANITLFTASRLLNQWQRDGILLKSRGKIVLRSPEVLLRRAA